MRRFLLVLLSGALLLSCQKGRDKQVDFLLQNGNLYDGSLTSPIKGDIAISADSIVWIGASDQHDFQAKQILDLTGMIVCPGFIDPHTHAVNDLLDSARNSNLPFLMQGVTTVMTGNDGGGPLDVAATMRTFDQQGIGTNAAVLVGHGTIRRAVMGLSADVPDSSQLSEMKKWVEKGMKAGALGLSSGLYYSPGSFAKTEEVIELAKIAAAYGGYYDTHMRDESTYNIGLLNAVREAIQIGKEGGLPTHIAHIKALGVDVWDQSEQVIALIDSARQAGLEVTADQYPYRASGTSLSACLVPRWVMQDSRKAFRNRLTNPKLLPRIKTEMAENLRKRGGAASLLITGSRDSSLLGKTLEDLAKERNTSAVDIAIDIVIKGRASVASFNMKEEDLLNFMQQEWVMTGSDGSSGHPRKYGSFPQKYQTYVKDSDVLRLEEFIHRSTLLTAQSIGLSKRGSLTPGSKADIIAFDPEEFRSQADFSSPRVLASGLIFAFINGQLVVKNGTYTGELAGKVLTH
ncbi:MAG: amidohydrolase family protein [Bacteroidota bacterium]